MVDTKHSPITESEEKEHRHRANQIRDLNLLETSGKGSGLDTLSEEQERSLTHKKRKLRSDEVKHH